jgi:acyl-CoA synthetase (AMP-forming)/AMP-acid ligase II
LKIDGWLSTAAQAVPEHTALIAGDESLTYRELDERARAVARRLAKLGVGRGDRVALALEPSTEYVVLVHGLVKLGAAAAPLDPRLTGTERDTLVDGLEPRLVIREAGEVLDAEEASSPRRSRRTTSIA